MSMTDTQQTVAPSIDLYTFWVTVQWKLLIPLIASVLLAVGTYQLTKKIIPNQWESSSFIIRHAKNMAKQGDVPYLYLNTDINTLLETILLQDNLLQVISELNLDISPKNLRKKVKINKTKKSNVVEIKVTWDSPLLASQIADKISETFLQNYTQIQNAATKEIYEYYVNKKAATNLELKNAREEESLFRSQNDVLDFEAQKENLYKYLAQLELRLVDEEVKQNDLISQLTHIDAKLASTEQKVITSELVRTNDGNRTKALRNELEVLRKRYTEDNPKVQHLLHKISVMEIEERSRQTGALKFDEVEYGPNPVFEELSLRKITLESELAAVKGNLTSYQTSIDRITARIERLSELAQTNLKIAQSITSKQSLIDTLNARLVEANLALESNISDFDILEYAQQPEHPKRSYRKLIAIVIAVMVAGLLTLIILVKEFIDTSLKTAHDLQHIQGADICAVLPDKDAVPESLFYSQFQLLFSEVDHALTKAGARMITVSSMFDREGKSFISSELAEQFVKQGKKVLYIESEEFLDTIPQEAIINDALYKGRSISTLQPNTVYDGLSKCYFKIDKDIYLDVLSETSMSAFTSSCYEQFDLVIWDVFPANRHLQLFRTLSQAAGFNLILTKSRATPKKHANKTLAMMNTWGIKNIGLLINALPKKYVRNQMH